jgi:ATP adenylyltransferase
MTLGFMDHLDRTATRFPNLHRKFTEIIHQQLWAPWRLPYIVENEERPAGCFLCRYLSQPEQDVENYVLFRGAASLIVLNRFPYNNGHLLVAPLAHKADLTDLTDEELLDCTRHLQKMIRIIRRVIAAEGFNIGLNLGEAAGAGLPGHLHWHLVPRWSGDTNFMSVTAGVHIIPQSLTALYQLLRAELDSPD